MRSFLQCHQITHLILSSVEAKPRRVSKDACCRCSPFFSIFEICEMGAYLYILLYADGSYYAGITRDSLEKRIAEHQAGTFGGYTSRRRPVKLVFQQYFERVEDAIAAERQVKGWRREKKEALIRGDFAALPALALSYQRR
jgi:putative endonuclease